MLSHERNTRGTILLTRARIWKIVTKQVMDAAIDVDMEGLLEMLMLLACSPEDELANQCMLYAEKCMQIMNPWRVPLVSAGGGDRLSRLHPQRATRSFVYAIGLC